jgi:hypothetical protein
MRKALISLAVLQQIDTEPRILIGWRWVYMDELTVAAA